MKIHPIVIQLDKCHVLSIKPENDFESNQKTNITWLYQNKQNLPLLSWRFRNAVFSRALSMATILLWFSSQIAFDWCQVIPDSRVKNR